MKGTLRVRSNFYPRGAPRVGRPEYLSTFGVSKGHGTSMNRWRLLNLLTLLSLLALTVAAWSASRTRPARAMRVESAPGEGQFLVCDGGGVYLVAQEVSQAPDGSWTAQVTGYGRLEIRAGNTAMAAAIPPPQASGFSASNALSVRMMPDALCTITYRAVGLPFWFLCLITAVPASRLCVHAWRRRRKARRGLCARCGYDLTGNVSGVCPECGTAAARPA
jgi:hypothetical protein